MQMLRLQLFRLSLIVLGATCVQTNAQIPANHEDENAVRVARIMQRALARCRTQVDGSIQKISWMPPTNEDVQEVKAMGEKAVVPLSRYVDSEHKDGFSELMAVRLLSAIGGQITEAPMKRALATDQWDVTRFTALVTLVGISKDHARPSVEAALNDHSSYVRQKASELYQLYYAQAQ